MTPSNGSNLCDLEAEASVVGSGILDPKGMDALRAASPKDFSDARLRAVWQAVLAVADSGAGVDLVTVRDQLSRAGQLEVVGGTQALMDLVDGVPAAALGASYARRVAELGRLRRFDDSLRTLAEKARSGRASAAELASETRAIADAGAGQDCERAVSIGDAFEQAAEDADAQARGERAAGLRTGFALIDDLAGPMEPGELAILAARPSMGKTTLALNIACNVAERGAAVGFLSLEMKAKALAMNAQARWSGVAMRDIRRGMTRDQYAAFQQAGERLRRLPLRIVEDLEGTPAEAAALARSGDGLGLLVVDYLQLMATPKAENRNLELAALTRSLKRLALERNLVVIALSQLSRECERRADKRPQLSDLRDSGALEQDADRVLLLQRPCKDLDDEEAARRRRDGVRWRDDYALLHVAKHRNGPTGRCILSWAPERMAFGDPPPEARSERVANTGGEWANKI